MDRTEASIDSAHDDDPPHPERTGRVGGRGRRCFVVAVLALVLGSTLVGGTAARATSPATQAAGAARLSDSMTLVSQSPWVGPSASNQDLRLRLRITSASPRSGLGLTVTVYHYVEFRSTFIETLAGKDLGTVIARSPTLALSSLPADASGTVDLTVPVDGDTTPATAGAWTADLGCVSGSCAGVYPVKVALVDTGPSGSPPTGAAPLVTYLVYDDPSPTSQPLRLGLVVPLGLASAGTPSTAAVAGLDALAGAVAGAGDVALTLAPDPATLETLATGRHGHTVASIAALSSSPARQTLSQSFVPVDASALVGAGLAGELTDQIRRAGQVLSSPAVGLHATRGTWVAQAPLDGAALVQLAPDYGHVVVPATSVSGPGSEFTVTQPFTLSSGHGPGPAAAVTDQGLDALLTPRAGTDPVLAAQQMLAELALVYYERPNLTGADGAPAPRGVVAAAPAAWAPDPTFVTALLAGLKGNPVVEPVTLDQLFAQVPIGADGQATVRRPVAPGTAPTLPARAIRSTRGQLTGLASAVSATAPGAAVAEMLDDLLLRAEASTLTPARQRAGVAAVEAALDGQVHVLTVRSDTIRLTSGAASVPITVVKNAPYPVTAVVKVTSDKLVFPGGAAQSPGADCQAPAVQSGQGRSTFSALCVVDRATLAIYVDMRSRTSGDFPIAVTLVSPQGGLVMASGQLTVRSMSTSVVALALSIAAGAVLLAWWARTAWRGRWGRRGAHAAGDGKGSS